MKISFKGWVVFILVAFLCFLLWYKFGYPQFSFVDLTIDKKEAFKKAESYLNSIGVDTKEYWHVIVFDSDDWSDRYLQKTLMSQAESFIKEHDYEIFSWKVRFFKQFQKEEYVITISPKSGAVLSFQHLIEDVAQREEIVKELAMQKAEYFLRSAYGLNLNGYAFHEEKAKRYDNRIDYTFSWEKKGVYIPWKKEAGGAKLLIGATISGNEVREFYKSKLDVPEKFERYIENQLVFGKYLSSISFLIYVFFVMSSIFIVVKRKHDLVVRLSKGVFFYLAVFLAFFNVVYIINNIQSIIMNYSTSVSFASFIGIYLIGTIISLIFLCVNFVMPGIAGESLCSEVFRNNKGISFLHYIKSTFCGRSMSRSVMLGYLVFFILLGFQAAIFYFGQKYLGVWREWIKLTQLSSAFLPFLSAFVIGLNASLSEEVIFRLFGISWLKKYLNNVILAIIVTSFIWGFGHSEYAIFPVWFRGIEVGMIGIIFGYIFLRYGIIVLLVAHYLFDVFWGVAAYILCHSSLHLFLGSAFMMMLPLVFALAAFLLNREEKEKEIKILMDKTQEYNLDVLITFVSAKKSQMYNPQSLRKELIRNNWDPSLVDLALEKVFKS